MLIEKKYSQVFKHDVFLLQCYCTYCWFHRMEIFQRVIHLFTNVLALRWNTLNSQNSVNIISKDFVSLYQL